MAIPRRDILDRFPQRVQSEDDEQGEGDRVGVEVRALRTPVATPRARWPRAQGVPEVQESLLEPPAAGREGVV